MKLELPDVTPGVGLDWIGFNSFHLNFISSIHAITKIEKLQNYLHGVVQN